MSVRILNCDVLDGLAQLEDESVDCIVTDPPYGETSLDWDKAHESWAREARRLLKPEGSMWVFGSLRSLMASNWFGWTLAQDLIWEKHNGSNSFADRFRRVHEQAAHFYKDDAPWASVYKKALFTDDARARVVRRKQRPPQWGEIGASSYRSEDGGPRLMRSVMFYRSMHGEAEHPTQKPVAVMLPLIEFSCPPGGVVLDPFLGSGTTALAALQLGCSCIGIEKDPKYAALARRRISEDCPMFASAVPAEKRMPAELPFEGLTS